MRKPISDRTWRGQQSVNREVIETVGVRRVRYTVRIDAYNFQSYARSEVWRDEWVQIHRISGEQLSTSASYVDKNVAATAFDADIDELRRVTIAILQTEAK